MASLCALVSNKPKGHDSPVLPPDRWLDLMNQVSSVFEQHGGIRGRYLREDGHAAFWIATRATDDAGMRSKLQAIATAYGRAVILSPFDPENLEPA